MAELTKKEREIEIMEFKIEDTDHLIANHMIYHISQKKIDALEEKKLLYVQQLEKIKAS